MEARDGGWCGGGGMVAEVVMVGGVGVVGGGRWWRWEWVMSGNGGNLWSLRRQGGGLGQ